MERHPDYRFLQSQAQLYEWVRQDYPALFDEIKKRVKTGQWEVGGAAWVEPDCNIPSGESLIRQLLLGTRYYAKHFGVTQNYFWQPDVFGYSAALPQILRLMGLDYFFSQKISWNQYNKFPHHTFKWVGIDGTGVVSHFFPADTYIGNNQPNELRHGEKNYQQSAKCPTWLQAFGWGDGGGGPTEDQVARVNVLKDCAGVPRTRHGRVDEFTAEIGKHADKLPSWHGELYLELHRGTYTSQAFTKKGNRVGERLLQDLEVAHSLSAIAGKPRTDADAAEVDRLWKLLLLNQFHDILPGSSIAWVYDDARRDYAEIHGIAAKLLTTGQRVLNTSGRARTEVVTKLNGHLELVEAPAMSIGEMKTITPPPLKVSDLTLENDHLRVTLDEVGRVTSLFDKTTNREGIRPGEFANQLMLFEDLPANWDAWDLDLTYRDKAVPITTKAEHKIVERGPVRAAIEFTRKIGNASTMKQRVQLAANGRFVEFTTHVDWHDSHKLLRAHHAVDVHADHATYEIQFGHVRRTNHFNTSWDYARFEVPAQRWMDLSETGFGVSLINDCKYGHSCLGNVMGLSLLRGTRSPDPKADIGEHVFRYALQPHGPFDAADAVAAAESLNQPLRLVDRPAQDSLVRMQGAGVVIDSLKPAEDGDGLILRLYECTGGRSSVALTFHSAIKSVTLVNLMESPSGDKLAMKHRVVPLQFKPFQIQTLRLSL
jgi:alpha-mannosidase